MGRLEQSFGGRGPGPGEFQYVRDLAVRGDSVYVLDSLLKRVSLFVSGALEREWSFPSIQGASERLFMTPGGRLALGVLRRPLGLAVPDGPAFHRDSVHVYAYSEPREGEWHELFAIPAIEVMRRPLSNGAVHFLIPPFRTNVSYDFSERGVVAAEHRDGWIRLWEWEGDSAQVSAPQDSSGYESDDEIRRWEESLEDHVQRIARAGGDPRVSRESARAAVDRWGGRIPRRVYENLITDGERIAVEEYQFGSRDPQQWLLLSYSGEALGRFVIPPNVRVHSLDGDRLTAVARDSLDVESVLLLRLRL